MTNSDQIKQRLAEYLELGTQNQTADLLRDCRTALEEQEAALASYWSFIMGMHYDKVGHLDAWPSYAKWKEIISTNAYAALLERLQKAEAQIQLQASFIGQLEDAVGPDLSVQEAVKGIGELKDRLQAVEKAGNIVLEAYSFIQNGTREPVSFTMKRPENDEKVFRLVIALNNFRKALHPAPQPKEAQEYETQIIKPA